MAVKQTRIRKLGLVLFHGIDDSNPAPLLRPDDAKCNKMPGTHTYPLPSPSFKQIPQCHSLVLR